MGSGIYNKWQQLGGEGNLLGCAASDEAEAGASPQGTTGRYAFFGAGDGGLIVWHGNGPAPARLLKCMAAPSSFTRAWAAPAPGSASRSATSTTCRAGSDFENGLVFWDEQDVDRLGSDYQNFDLSEARYELCRDACANDPSCRAYSYVKPGIQALNARCWLKSSVSDPVPSPCCISGVKQ